MSSERNAPCPCGSGRKYKHCCMRAQRDEAASQGSGRFGRLEPEVRRAAAAAGSWQAEALPFLAEFDDEAVVRPVAMLVTAAGLVIHANVLSRLGGSPAAVAAAIDRAVAAAAREVGAWPPLVQVRHAEVADALRPALAPRDVRVEAVDELPEFEDAARTMLDTMQGGATWPPIGRALVWTGWALPRRRIAEVFAAAAAYWRAGPWRAMANLQAPRAVLPSGREWTACVLGNAGQEFGLSLYSDARDLFVGSDAASAESPFGDVRGRILGLTFDHADEVPPAMLREARTLRWEIAAPGAFPSLITVNAPGGGITEDDAHDLVLLLGALPAFAAKHRTALLREERTGTAVRPIDWLHEPTGVRLRYAGEALRAGDGETGGPSSAVVEGSEIRRQVQAAIREAVAEVGEDATQEQLEAAVRRAIDGAGLAEGYNRSPQPGLGGLSPQQVRRLLEQRSWTDGTGPIRLRQDLALADIDAAPFPRNVRALLTYAAEQDGLSATQAGNLKVAVVAALLERLELDPERTSLPGAKRITERDVWPLHEARVIADVAGLLALRRGRFVPTPAGGALLDAAAAGRLLARLVEAMFRQYNLSYGTLVDWPELQHQIAFTFSRLGVAARDWQRATALMRATVLPFALEYAPRDDDLSTRVAFTGVLERLVGFGLLERQNPRRSYAPGHVESYRVTERWSRLVDVVW